MINTRPNRPFLLIFLTVLILGFSASGFAGSGFTENTGQLRDQQGKPNNKVLFLYCGSGLKVQLRKTGYSYELIRVNKAPAQQVEKNAKGLAVLSEVETMSYRIDVDFKDMDPAAQVITEGLMPGYDNFFLSGEKGYTGVRSFSKIVYRNIYPFTDAEFVIDSAGGFKYNILLHPGADINQVKLLVKGASGLTQRDQQTLMLATPQGTIAEHIPLSYYLDDPATRAQVNFSLRDSTISFSSQHDPKRSLVIDPTCNRIWGTFYGGSSIEYCNATGHDSLNNVYITGYALSTNNIATSGTHQAILNGGFDIFLTKFSATGIRQWGTYFGGASPDVAYAIYVEKNGNTYIAGATLSTSNIATFNAHQIIFGGGLDDALLAKFDPNGIRLWASYYGGTEHDIAQALTVDRNGNPIITGHTESVNNMATTGAYATSYNFAYDVFIAKFNSFGSRLWGTYYGDSDLDEAYGIACDSLGDIYITGGTASTSGISTAGTHQQNNAGFLEGFVSKFNTAGNTLLWSTYYGGPGNDFGTVIEVDRTGRVFVGGTTGSSSGISTPGSHQATAGSVDDSFLAAFSNNGQRLWGTYFGGNDVDYINDLLIDHNGDLYFCGSSTSPNAISTAGAYQASLSTINNYDAYFCKFSPAGQQLFGTYYGSEGNDIARGITMDNTARVYLAGETTSTTNLAIPGAHQFFQGGTNDAFVAKFCMTPEPVITPSGTSTMCAGSITLSTQSWYTTFLWNGTYVGNPLVLTNTVTGSYTFAVYVNDFGCEAASDTVTINLVKCQTGTGLADYSSSGFLIYPNPARDLVHFDPGNMSGPWTVSIYATSGACVYEITSKADGFDLHLAQLPRGLYMVRINAGGQSLTKKLILE